MAEKTERPVDEIEKKSGPEDVPLDNKLHVEEDWTHEEERKLVYVKCSPCPFCQACCLTVR